jgi:predicted glycosyltransferase
MRILFDIVHPADVHFFRNAIIKLVARDHQVLLASRVKDVTIELLDGYGLPHTVVSRQSSGCFGLLGELLIRSFALAALAKQFKPDLLIANNSPCASHIGFLLRRPSCVFDDTEINRYARWLFRFFVREIHTPQCHQLNLGAKQSRYAGYHPLAYLHPDLFQPDSNVPRSYGLDTNKPLIIFRFVHWGAAHDLGAPRMSDTQKVALVEFARRYGQVVVIAEGKPPEPLQGDTLKLQPIDMHQLLAGASCLIGESATMCAEAACLGVPSLLIDAFGRGYTDDIQQRYGLITRHSPRNWNNIIDAMASLLAGNVDRSRFAREHRRLLEEHINVTDYQLAQIERLGLTDASGH